MRLSPIIAISVLDHGRAVVTLQLAGEHPFLEWLLSMARLGPFETFVYAVARMSLLDRAQYSTYAEAVSGHATLAVTWGGRK